MGRVGCCLIYAADFGRGVGLYTAGGDHLRGPNGFGWGVVGAVSLGGFKLFSTLFIYFDLGVDMGCFARTVGDAAPVL